MAITNFGGGASVGDWSTPGSTSSYTPYPHSGRGAITAQAWIRDVVPLTKQTANIALTQHITAGSAMALAAGTGSTATTVAGISVIALDTPRALTAGSAATISTTLTVKGF